jgi:hypothetical protein
MDHELGLVAEIKVPGRAWLQFEVGPNSRGSVIRQTAIFDPPELARLLYWSMLYPVHRWIFSGMLNEIALSQDGGQLFPRSGHDRQFPQSRITGLNSRAA